MRSSIETFSIAILLILVQAPLSADAFASLVPAPPPATSWQAQGRPFRPAASPPGHVPRGRDTRLRAQNGIWNTGGSFGKGEFRFYRGLDSYMAPFPDEDRVAFPQRFRLSSGVYEVALRKPCGILFEEIEPGCGVYVQGLVEGGNAARQGTLRPGDVLVGITAVQISGAKWERRLIPARKFGFDLVVGAIGSNEEKWGCDDVILMVERPGEAEEEQVDEWLEFFEPPGDTPWKLPV